MRILQVCKKFPYPLKDGEVKAIHSFTKAFHELGNDVVVLAINTPKHFFDTSELPVEIIKLASFFSVNMNTNVNWLKSVLNLFTSKSYNIERFYSPAFEVTLEKLLQENSFDLIELEGAYLSQYIDVIRKHSKAKVVLRSHNVEYEIWERESVNANSFLKKWYFGLCARRMKRYEMKWMNKHDAIVPITERDANHYRSLGCSVPMHVCEYGVDLNSCIPDHSKEEFPTVFHIGSMDWRPNVQGVKWFLENVWQRVLEKIPNAKLFLAGRNFPGELMEQKFKNTEMIGEVNDAVGFMQSKGVMIVPLFSGSGIRVKLIEAMALGKAVVTTSVGAEGIPGFDGGDFVIADNAESFSAALVKCLTDKKFCSELQSNARTFAESHFNYLKLVEDVLSFYHQLIVK